MSASWWDQMERGAGAPSVWAHGQGTKHPPSGPRVPPWGKCCPPPGPLFNVNSCAWTPQVKMEPRPLALLPLPSPPYLATTSSSTFTMQ